MIDGRTCGHCTECCTVMKIEELGKPSGVKCEAVRREGCAIYAQRPHSCRVFECLWLMGFGANGHRPDRSGVVLHAETSDKLGKVIVVNEARPNALRGAKGKQVFKKLRQAKMDVYIRYADGSVSLQGSKEFMEKARAVVEGMDEERRSKVRLKVVG